MCEKDYRLKPSTCTWENSKYLKSVIDTLVTNCDWFVIVMNNLSNITTNVLDSASINCHREKSKKLLYFAYFFIDYDYIIDSG